MSRVSADVQKLRKKGRKLEAGAPMFCRIEFLKRDLPGVNVFCSRYKSATTAGEIEVFAGRSCKTYGADGFRYRDLHTNELSGEIWD
jgi:hypothetical protein